MFKVLKFAAAVAVAGAVLIPSAACTLNPTITSYNQPNACGGSIHVSGSGFTPNGKIEIEVLGYFQQSGWVDYGSTTATSSGAFSNFDANFWYPGPGVVPGCAFDAPLDNTVTVMAKDVTTGSVTFSTADTLSCPVAIGICPA
jgi:hypothetical protein